MTARQLRNRVLNILDRDDTMQANEVREEEVAWTRPLTEAVAMSELLPAISLSQGGRDYMIIFRELPRKT